MSSATPTAIGARTIRVGTRGSALALAQSELVAHALAALGVQATLEVIATAGDLRPPDTAWGEGAFVGAIEQALIDGRIDMAVHSAKDVPTDEDPRLAIVAYLERADPRDVLVVAGPGGGATIDELPPEASLGTDSPRRSGFLRARRPDLDIRPLHGNVDTRLRRLDEGAVDGLVLAAAGLQRLGRADRIAQLIPPEQLPPAPGQGALCVQVRADDSAAIELGVRLDHQPTRRAVEAERAFLAAVGGGCRAPLGALARVEDGRLHLLGGFADLDGRAAAVELIEGPADAGPALAAELAARLLERRRGLGGGPRVLVTRPADTAADLAQRLLMLGLDPVVVPAIAIEPAPPGGPLDDALRRLADYRWAVATSANGVATAAVAAERLGIALATTRWAAVGSATARALRRHGIAEAWQPSRSDGASLGATLPFGGSDRILLLRGSLADATLPGLLRARGAKVDDLVAYRTVEAPSGSVPLLNAALADGRPLAAVIYSSPSQVRGLLTLAGARHGRVIEGLPAVCIGATTGSAARAAGLTVIGMSPMQDAAALAELTAELVARVPGGAAR